MKRKRILHISNYYPPHTGGIEYVCHMIVSSLKEYAHSVICFGDIPQTTIDDYEGVRVVRIGSSAKIASQALSVSYFFHLRNEIKTFSPEIIHFHAPNPLISIYLLAVIPSNVKLVVHYHAEILTSRFLYYCYLPWEKKMLKRADVIITTSPKLRDEASPLIPYKSKCRIVENAISTKELDVKGEEQILIEDLKAKYGNRPIVLTFGRHVLYKGLKYLIEAEGFISTKCEIIIGGSGPITQQLKEISHSPRIHFVGRIPDEQLRIYLYAASVFAFPSITKAEAFGLTLVQAMYCGAPPVTFTIPASGVNFVNLNDITGFEVGNGESESFANAIDRILIDEKLHGRFVNAGRKHVMEHFTVDILARKITHIYNNLVEK